MSDALTDDADVDSQPNHIRVNWGDLWEEFGFDTPDAAGNKMASKTQLIAALQSTEQQPDGDAKGHIRNALTAGELVRRESTGGALRGYVFVGGEK